MSSTIVISNLLMFCIMLLPMYLFIVNFTSSHCCTFVPEIRWCQASMPHQKATSLIKFTKSPKVPNVKIFTLLILTFSRNVQTSVEFTYRLNFLLQEQQYLHYYCVCSLFMGICFIKMFSFKYICWGNSTSPVLSFLSFTLLYYFSLFPLASTLM